MSPVPAEAARNISIAVKIAKRDKMPHRQADESKMLGKAAFSLLFPMLRF